jgi:signal transduction histidine kinase
VRVDCDYYTAELHELAASLNGMAVELQEAEKRQQRLTADVAHELRTPLTCLQGEIEAMLDGVWEPTAQRLESCREETKRLTKLVEDLSSLTAIEWQGITLDKTDFDISDLIGTVALGFESALREKNITLNCRLPKLTVHADYDRLKQVFYNLLANAVKYTDTGSITITAVQKANAQCVVTIADTGIGIGENELPHIFERFYRTDKSRNRTSGGSGIGLTIARAIIQAHGGTIGAVSPDSGAPSEGGKGSVFTVVV